MQLELPDKMQQLVSNRYIKPFSYYLNRDPWSLKKERIVEDFLNKKGVYCFWWSGDIDELFSSSNKLEHLGYAYDKKRREFLNHFNFPLYVGMTAMAAYTKGNSLRGRLVDRLIRFPNVFSEYKRRDRYELCKRKTGTCGFFDLFNFPKRIRESLSTTLGKELSLEDAEKLLIDHQGVVVDFDNKYKDIFYNNVSISFVEVEDEAELFYLEALAIGCLRPWLNHS